MAHVIVERTFANPISDEEISSNGKRAKPCEDERKAKWLRTVLSIDRKRMICEYEAPDAESVREAQRSAGMPFDRVWTAIDPHT
jgi:hypothetical protein